jgi:hypothetical protein
MSDDLKAMAAREAITASKLGKRSRNKGIVWEREVARRLRDIYPEAKRGAQSRTGRDAPDVVGLPWHVECKCGVKPNPRAALDQATRDSRGLPVVVAIHDDAPRPGTRAREWVAMPWVVFEALARTGASRPIVADDVGDWT